mmetsp:Transcript_48655/g.136000  ORF Transcript_48655/g.136000 Transcript_48655/m.136000 type:complete len:582 (-) Transcript_48655:144-1889(-)
MVIAARRLLPARRSALRASCWVGSLRLCACARIFGDDQDVPAVDLSRYTRSDLRGREAMLEPLDRELQDRSVASLVLASLNSVAAETLDIWRQQFRERLATMAQSEWAAGGVGWLWPNAAEMYSHPHYLVTVGDDDRTSPADLPFNMGDLLDSIRLEAIPVLEDLLEVGLRHSPGSLTGKMRMTKVIVHYYPTVTAREKLLTHAAFHSDDSFLTLNFENVPGMHGLRAGSGACSSIRKFNHVGLSTYPVNLFVGGYLQALSKGRYLSLIHSGSNPGPQDRVSVTVFLGMPSLNQYANTRYGGTRGHQEGEVHKFLRDAAQWDSGTAESRLAEIQGLYSASGALPTFYDGGRSGEAALTRSYALVGSWSGWASFDEFVREAEDDPVLRVRVAVPANEDVEFQMVCDGDWNQRIVPSGFRGEMHGPSADGHGKNWKLDAPAAPAVLHVEWDPMGKGSLRFSLTEGNLQPCRRAKPGALETTAVGAAAPCRMSMAHATARAAAAPTRSIATPLRAHRPALASPGLGFCGLGARSSSCLPSGRPLLWGLGSLAVAVLAAASSARPLRPRFVPQLQRSVSFSSCSS